MWEKKLKKEISLVFKVIVSKTCADLLSVTVGTEIERAQNLISRNASAWYAQQAYEMSVSTNSCQLQEKGAFFLLLIGCVNYPHSPQAAVC